MMPPVLEAVWLNERVIFKSIYVCWFWLSLSAAVLVIVLSRLHCPILSTC